MKSKRPALILSTLIAGFAASPQAAADTGFYGYVSAGQSPKRIGGQ